MTLEVYTRTKPAHTRRTLLSCLVLMLGTMLLADQMTRHRAAQLLGERVELSPMGCSIRPPSGSALAKTVTMPQWQGQTFHDTESPWAPAKFAVWHTSLEEPHASERLATEIFEDIHAVSGVSTHIPSHVRSRDVFIGRYPAVELWNEVNGVVVRVAEAPRGGYFALSMVSAEPYRVWRSAFDRSCRSLAVTP